MPQRNIFWLLLIALISLVCYQEARRNPYGSIFVDAMDQIHDRSLTPIAREELFEGAMRGMMQKLDQYSGFISAEEMQAFNEVIGGEFVGLGVEVTLDPKTEQLTVISPIYNSPAAEAGIVADDVILRIDDISTRGLSLSDAVRKMKGKPGDPVVLTVLHRGEEKPVEITIIREKIQADTVLGDRRDEDGQWDFFLEGPDRIGYVRIEGFARNTPEELEAALEELNAGGMQGLILDLRDNPGGLLTAAIEICDMFIDADDVAPGVVDPGVIVTTRNRAAQIVDRFTATSGVLVGDIPVAVLVNGESASASEIVSACLQDYGRAAIIGQRTWGKGTVQEVITLADQQGAMRLTTCSYWRPSERDIHRDKDKGEADDSWGVTPDEGYEVKLEGAALRKLRMWRADHDRFKPADENDQSRPDPQLKKAVEYIEEAIAAEKAAPVAA